MANNYYWIDINKDNFVAGNFYQEDWRTETLTKLEYYESEYRKLKEMMSLLELALWKSRISSLDHGKVIGGGNEKLMVDQSDLRLQCRVSCGADHVIENVWPFLMPPDFVRSYVSDDYEDEDSDSFDNENDEDDHAEDEEDEDDDNYYVNDDSSRNNDENDGGDDDDDDGWVENV